MRVHQRYPCSLHSLSVEHGYSLSSCRLLTDADRAERLGVGREPAAILARIGFRIMLEHERHHLGLFRVRPADRIEGGIGEDLDAEFMIDEINRVEFPALAGELLHTHQG